MSKLITGTDSDPNYLAQVVQIKEILNHPNPKVTRLRLTNFFGNQVIVTIENFVGEKMVYLPVESTIAADYLSWGNMYDESNMDLNRDPKVRGYFSKKRRVRACRLQGEVSNGIVIPVAKIVEFINNKYDMNFTEEDFPLGASFDKIHVYGNEIFTFTEKYIPQITKQGGTGEGKQKSKDLGISKLLLPNQFRLHGKTTQLGLAVYNVKPQDLISISSKLHGTSAVFSNVLCNRPLSFIDKVAKFFGAKVVEQEYRFVYSSRTVIKNRKDGDYTSDVWGLWAERLESKIPAGITVYGEIVGHTPNGKEIQSGYPYGCNCLESQFYIYRVTYTDKNGALLEFDWQQVQDFAETYELEVCPTYYHGKAADLFDINNEDPNWSELFLAELKETYLEKPCEFCNNGNVREGVCLRRENTMHKNAYKLKSFSFLEKESKDRDNDVTNIEEEA